MNPEVDWFFKKTTKWQDAYQALRIILLECGLTETLKWGCPCYTFQEKNIVLIHGFKDYCALLFMQGALLKDPKHILIQQTEHVQSARQIRFTSKQDIIKLKAAIKSYVKAAIAMSQSGIKMELKKTSEFKIPEEFQSTLNEWPALKKAFDTLTPGRQRGYLLFFAAAKQAKTRVARIEKYSSLILNGKGLDDK